MRTNMRILRLACLASICLSSGCALLQGGDSQTSTTNSNSLNVVDITTVGNSYWSEENTNAQNYDDQDNFGAPGQPPLYSSVRGAYKGRPLTKHVGDYVKNLTQDLVTNMDYVTQKTPIGVTHFALIDSDLQQTNLLGMQMAESFIHEFHKFRIPVVDFKATDYIRVTEQGDFLLSRDYLELEGDAPIDYVLTGTMSKHQGGFLVNARLIGMKSHAVVASAQTLIPFYVADAVIASDLESRDGMQDGVRISKGN